MKDNQLPGDRTLALFLIENQLEFGTYDYHAPLNIVHKVQSQMDWAYVYFAYDWNTQRAYCYIKFIEN